MFANGLAIFSLRISKSHSGTYLKLKLDSSNILCGGNYNLGYFFSFFLKKNLIVESSCYILPLVTGTSMAKPPTCKVRNMAGIFLHKKHTAKKT